MMEKRILERRIAVLGLGQMGRRMAEMYVEQGYQVTVWNRNLSKAKDLSGVIVATSVEQAIADNEIIIICVLDNKAVSDILGQAGEFVFSKKTLINLTTGNPQEAKELESRLTAHGGVYLNGAIQVAPEQMGQPDTTILMAGNKERFNEVKAALDVLGGNIKFLGANASASPAMDLATLSWVYGSYIGLLYGAALVQAEGMQLQDFRDIVGEIAPSFVEFFRHEVNMIQEGNYNITQSPLIISVGATQRIAEAASAAKLDTAFTNVMAGLLQKAQARGFENQEVTAVLKVINTPEK
ncbi:NAD(P)-dependent oxidoreductase [Pseudobacter ginsenosidimutans]|jgi:3-hydroxyisobutyrate dehydrogenase-like beta-hydroxyacid dehydrogenase|uniref:3-hydroxyisobutyrate dehydrogenase-like beta-hydroxyacid dehydrogenase n=1 Tax=Pseudobacter ginsenosidimutans TaxID=661488 RepID=A0A4Q7N439_9BACT|nr:NAD(P)-binding domain-containing protein [Pseudobacter ginsenosidimutans]QEC44294.1 NAD(P)-dependent oxidoreductase [Pseudobacter ginsenosidimutans]RZS75755.1 3-hydroxyisobutyrate dehydrogenase-like beta-hydroxyacid dehydrogenase [Pseudobacter ginsenosidimutans]